MGAAWGGKASASGAANKGKNAGKKKASNDSDDDDDDFDDMFGDDDDDDDEEDDDLDPTERLEKLAAKGDAVAAAKLKVVRAKAAKAAKKEEAGRTMIIFEIKPFDDETVLRPDLENKIRSITEEQIPGLKLWGQEARLEPIGYGINKLIMSAIVLDSACGVDDITEYLEAQFGEDGKQGEFIQSIEVPTMSKV